MRKTTIDNRANFNEVITDLIIANILIIICVCLYMYFNDPHEVSIASNHVTKYFLHKHDYSCYSNVIIMDKYV